MQGVIFFPLVLSLALSYRLLEFPDITIEGTFALGAAIFCAVLSATKSYSLASSCSIFSCGLAGACTAWLHHYLKINKFLAGIIVVTALYSVIVRVLNGGNISILNVNSSDEKLTIVTVAVGAILVLFSYQFYRSPAEALG